MIVGMSNKKVKLHAIDQQVIIGLRRSFLPLARAAFFIVFFWFGFLKLLGLSPATPLAEHLIDQTVGAQYFELLFYALAVLECVIGILFLFPKMTRVVIPLLLIHMAIVCSPLLLLLGDTWQSFLVPTLEGQYIIKNAAIIALAIGIAASTEPLAKRTKD